MNLSRPGALIAAAMMVLSVAVSGCGDGTGSSQRPTEGEPSQAQAASASPEGPGQVQTVSGQFNIRDRDWVALIEGSEWNRCDGEPECDGHECYGIGQADGIGYGTKVLVTNADMTKVALSQIDSTWGWTSRRDGYCTGYWSVDVPVKETGVLTVTFNDSPEWAVDFTLKQMRAAPHSLDFISIGG